MSNEISLTLVRKLAAPVETVYTALTHPEILSEWFAPDDMTVKNVVCEPQVGGAFSVTMKGKEGEFTASGSYSEVVPNEKLVQSWHWHDGESTTELQFDLRPLDDGWTELTLTHRGFPDASVRDNHNEGWTSCLARLEARYN